MLQALKHFMVGGDLYCSLVWVSDWLISFIDCELELITCKCKSLLLCCKHTVLDSIWTVLSQQQLLDVKILLYKQKLIASFSVLAYIHCQVTFCSRSFTARFWCWCQYIATFVYWIYYENIYISKHWKWNYCAKIVYIIQFRFVKNWLCFLLNTSCSV